jgi:hypothetical protein
VLGLIGLLRVLPAGWPRNLARAGYFASALGLLLIAVPFASEQVVRALYPQTGAAEGRLAELANADAAAPMIEHTRPSVVEEAVEEALEPAREMKKALPSSRSYDLQQEEPMAGAKLDRTLAQDPEASSTAPRGSSPSPTDSWPGRSSSTSTTRPAASPMRWSTAPSPTTMRRCRWSKTPTVAPDWCGSATCCPTSSCPGWPSWSSRDLTLCSEP